MAIPPLGPPPRLLGLKITSNRIESALIMFVFICLSLIFYGNNMSVVSEAILLIGFIWAAYLWIFKKPERPY
ncbi:MAG: hypothetical protein HN866_01760 [Gammaproteobacteria bacterium]|jgi:hypothetical protein|nr:hypothetical protein [Gammaproteobacteria bacterium]|tara:strand:- start:33 stop:248 length:216 start_codon:yes stop_codon:yes gene_type:complete